VGAKELDRRLFSLSFPGYRLLIERPVVKGRGVGINRVFLVTFLVSIGYSTFGFGSSEILGVVGPTVVVEYSLEAPSSSAYVRVCNKTGFGFVGSIFRLELVGLPGVWLAGCGPGTLWCSMWSFDGRGSGAGSGWYRCVFAVESRLMTLFCNCSELFSCLL
jgi:hypothetical protein